jgi:integrase
MAPWAEEHLERGTWATYGFAVAAYEGAGAEQVVSRIRPDHLDAYKRARREVGRAVTTVNDELRSLRAIVNRAIRQGWYVGRNPFAGVTMLPLRHKAPRWLDKAQIDAVMDAASLHSRNAHLFFALGIFAGLRKGEAVQARWEWVDFDAGLLHVRGRTKSKRERTIPLHDRLRAVLELYRAADGYIIAPAIEPGIDRYRYDVRKGFAAVVAKAHVPWCTPHTLRHTFASRLVSEGVDLYKVSIWLGHADYKTTQIYAHLRPQDADINRL